jgi:hypothetical protein
MQYLRVLSVWQKTWDKQLNRRKDLLLLMSAEVSVHSHWVLHLLGPMNRNVLRGSFLLLSGWGLGRRKRGQEGSFKVTFTENDVLPLGPNSSYCSGDQAFNAWVLGGGYISYPNYTMWPLSNSEKYNQEETWNWWTIWEQAYIYTLELTSY